MTRILIIDDEPINHQLVAHALEPLKCELHFSANGKDGVAKARNLKPDLIITDVMMPDINGYEVTRILRRESQFAVTPILVLTAQSGLQDKLKSFEAGADDHLTKPFDTAELMMRVSSLLRRVEALKSSQQTSAGQEQARVIAVHSLRGGTGSSTLAVNLGVGLFQLWKRPTILLDLTMTAGQVALMLNMSLRRTWADIARYGPGDLDMDALNSIIGSHESGLSFIAAPTFPADAEMLRGETLNSALHLMAGQFDYMIADLPHDFSESAIQALDMADLILVIATPDMASVRAVIAALDTYEKLGYAKDKIKFVLSAPFLHSSLTREKIESALGMPAIVTIPHIQDVLVDAINLGQPVAYHRPKEMISGVFEDFCFLLSKDIHRKTKPENPTDAWKRVYKRYQERKK